MAVMGSCDNNEIILFRGWSTFCWYLDSERHSAH